MAESYDAIIIGTGQSGPALAARLVGAGLSVAVIERKRFGGTCVNNGCTPTKTMVASARAAYMARRAGDFGVNASGTVSVDMTKVKARKDEIVERFSSGVESRLKGLDNATVYEGHGRFVGPRTVAVGERELTADKIFINVGGRATTPRFPGIETISYLNNSSIMDLDVLPQHLVLFGGSYIGLEFGQVFRRLGSEVTVINRGPRLLSREDEDISIAVREILEGEGLNILTDTSDVTIDGTDGDVTISLTAAGKPETVQASHVLAAIGRVPNTHDLGLEAAGIETDKRGFITVNDALETSVPGVWAIGDCNGRGAFTHTSYNEYEIVAANLLDGDDRKVSDRITAYAVFIDPPLGRVGMTEREARESGRNVLVGKLPMAHVARAIERDETQGFMKVLVDADTEEILGASLLGIGCDEIVHGLMLVMYSGASYKIVQRAMHIHPTVAELIPTLLGNLEPLT